MYRSAMICNGALPHTPLKGQMSLENPVMRTEKPPPFGGGFFHNISSEHGLHDILQVLAVNDI